METAKRFGPLGTRFVGRRLHECTRPHSPSTRRMDGLRSSRTLFSGGFLLGMVLVFGPVLQSVQGSCSRSTESVPASAERSEIAAPSSDAAQWTCEDRVAVVVRAVSSERPDTPSHGGHPSASIDAERPAWTVVAREGQTNAAVFISPVLEALRPIVLQI